MPIYSLDYFNEAWRLSSTCNMRQLWETEVNISRLTSSSILASAMSCSLPLPLAIFCASAIWFLTAYFPSSQSKASVFSGSMLTSALKSLRGNPSTALMLSCEPGCTTAKPPDTVICTVSLNSGSTVTFLVAICVKLLYLCALNPALLGSAYRRIACFHQTLQ